MFAKQVRFACSEVCKSRKVRLANPDVCQSRKVRFVNPDDCKSSNVRSMMFAKAEMSGSLIPEDCHKISSGLEICTVRCDELKLTLGNLFLCYLIGIFS
jgi:hypothetical protein